MSLIPIPGNSKDEYDALVDHLANLFAYKEYTISHGTINQYGAKTGDISISVSGYVPFSIRSYSNSDDHMILYECSITSTKLYYKVKNYDSSPIASASTIIRVAYIKSPSTVTELT